MTLSGSIAATVSNAVSMSSGALTLNGGTLTALAGMTVSGGTFSETSGTDDSRNPRQFPPAARESLSGGTFNAGSLTISGGTVTLSGSITSNVTTAVTVSSAR